MTKIIAMKKNMHHENEKSNLGSSSMSCVCLGTPDCLLGMLMNLLLAGVPGYVLCKRPWRRLFQGMSMSEDKFLS